MNFDINLIENVQEVRTLWTIEHIGGMGTAILNI